MRLINNDKRSAIILIGLYLLISFIWHFSTNAPWDDDCFNRYLNTKRALGEPIHFISMWNRPLFVVLFALPFQLSKHFLLLMACISAGSAYALYRGLVKLKIDNAPMVIVFFLFQAFYFTISRSALAEPLAAALIAFGFYFYAHKRLLGFAIMGSLIPLARLELSLLVLFWVYVLIKEKAWKYLPVLGIPVLLWNLGGFILNGEALWLLEKTMSKDTGSNNYGHKTFGHYFQRYIYFMGPIIFYFFLIGFIESMRKKKLPLYIMFLFVLGFMIYVVFSWKLNLGNAAGFLRHMGALASLSSVIAVVGYNKWIGAIVNGKKKSSEKLPEGEKEDPELEYKQTVDNAKEKYSAKEITKKQYKKLLYEASRQKETALKKGKATPLQKKRSKSTANAFRIAGYSFGILVLCYFFFSFRMENHHNLKEDSDYTNIILIGFMFLIFSVLFLIRKHVTNMGGLINSFIVVLVMAYAMITEPPNSHVSTERTMMTEITGILQYPFFRDKPLYINNYWYHWVLDEEVPDRAFRVNKETLANAEEGATFLWDNHYSLRFKEAAPYTYFQNKPEFVELMKVVTSDNTFTASIIKKTSPTASNQSRLKLFEELINLEKNNTWVYTSRASFKLDRLNDMNGALEDLNKAIALDSSNIFAYSIRGHIYFRQKRFDLASKDYVIFSKLRPESHLGFYNNALCLASLKRNKESLEEFSRAISKKGDYFQSYLNRGKVYNFLNGSEAAIRDFSRVIQLNRGGAQEAYYLRGVTHIVRLKDVQKGCADLQASLKLGDSPKVRQLITQYCSTQ
jgi:tetratricopeptide (TPR) repeat protein